VNDLTLLSLVAQAAGKVIGWSRDGPVVYDDLGHAIPWHPLIHNGDAFLLQTALPLRLVVHDTYAECFPDPDSTEPLVEPVITSKEAAARQVLCRAAATHASGAR
jgi:hypothetical protein